MRLRRGKTLLFKSTLTSSLTVQSVLSPSSIRIKSKSCLGATIFSTRNAANLGWITSSLAQTATNRSRLTMNHLYPKGLPPLKIDKTQDPKALGHPLSNLLAQTPNWVTTNSWSNSKRCNYSKISTCTY